MTPGAIVSHASVIKHAGGKSTGVVAHPTILGSGDMCGGFTRGDRAVVAGCAIAGDTFVREDRGPKRRGGMTKVAILRSGYMICGRFLARGINTIVTPVTAIGDTGVIKHAGSKTTSNMAHGTIFRGRNMIHWLASRVRAVVTGGAVVHDTGVIEHRIEKTTGDMTDAAVLGGRQVVDMFASGRYSIVTGGTVVHDAGMIKHRGSKRSGAMAA